MLLVTVTWLGGEQKTTLEQSKVRKAGTQGGSGLVVLEKDRRPGAEVVSLRVLVGVVLPHEDVVLLHVLHRSIGAQERLAGRHQRTHDAALDELQCLAAALTLCGVKCRCEVEC